MATMYTYIYICHELWKAGRPCTAATSAIPAIGAGIPPGWASWKCLSKWRQLHIIVHCMYGINSDIIIICLIIYIYIYIVSNDSYILYTYIYIYTYLYDIYIYNHIYIYIYMYSHNALIYIYIYISYTVAVQFQQKAPCLVLVASALQIWAGQWASTGLTPMGTSPRQSFGGMLRSQWAKSMAVFVLTVTYEYLWYTYDTCEILCTYEWSVEPAQ